MSDSHDDQPDWNFGERDVIEKLKLYVWSAPPMFYAVAHARSVAHARELMLGQIGESGDGSCAERDKARERILTQAPSIWAAPNAEFALTDSAELAEADAHRETLEATIKALTAKLAEKEAELSALYHDFERQREEFRRELEVYWLQRQQLEATNKYYLDVITGVKALEPPPPIIIDNMDKVAKLEAELEAARLIVKTFIEAIGECTCHEAYTSRRLQDPTCHFHIYDFAIEDGLKALTPEAKEPR